MRLIVIAMVLNLLSWILRGAGAEEDSTPLNWTSLFPDGVRNLKKLLT
jgi:hypothetical protein